MELSPEQQKALEEQKKNCVFCKLISGEIPGKKVYEDDKVIALLDINPLAKGHILILPKEHYPIMPLVPEETFKHMFNITRDLAIAEKKALLKTGTTTLIANGGVAGQMAPHFMFHLIPREEGDGITNFETIGTGEPPTEDDFTKALKNNLPIMMQRHFQRHPSKWHSKGGSPTFSKERVIEIISENPQILEIIQKTPHLLHKQIEINDQLKQLFKDQDIDEIIRHFNPGYVTDKTSTSAEPNQDIYALIEQNPKVKEFLIKDPEILKKQVIENPDLQALFKGYDLDELSKHFREKNSEESNEEPNAQETATDDLPQPVPVGSEEEYDDVHKIIEENPRFRDMLINDTENLKKRIASKPELTRIFRNHDIDALAKKFGKVEEDKNKIYDIIEENPKLKAMIIDDPYVFKRKVDEIPQLKEMFEGYDIDEIIRHYKKDDDDSPDFDKITEMFK